MSRLAPPIRFPRTLTALAALGALTTAAAFASPSVAAAGQPAADVPQTSVSYNLLDLSTDNGTRTLYARIKSAARAVCPTYDSRDLAAFAESRQCQREAVARAITQIGNARLAAVHARATTRHG